MRPAALLLLFPMLLGTSGAYGQPSATSVRLEYTPAPGCPDEQGFRDVVAAQMKGSDPFTVQGARRMTVTLTRRARDYQGVVALYDEAGKPLGQREHTGSACAAVVEDIGTSISIVLQSSAPPVIAPPPLPPTAAPLPPDHDPQPPASLPPAAPAPPLLRLGVGAQLAGGIAPSIAGGFVGSAGLRWSRLSLSLEARGDLPASGASQTGGTVRTSFLGGSFVPCFHEQWFLGCAIVTAGRVLASGPAGSAPASQSAAYAGAGLRVGGEYFFTPHIGAQVVGDVLLGLARPGIRIAGADAWSAAVVSESIGLRLVAAF